MAAMEPAPEDRLSLLPQERRTYIETALPVATGIVMSRGDLAAVMFAAATVACVFAHAAGLVAMGHHGDRPEHRASARRWALIALATTVVLGLVAVGLAPQEASMWLFVPIVLAAIQVPWLLGGSVRTLAGELVGGAALAAMVLPVALAGRVTPLLVVIVAAVAWAVTFVVERLTVRYITRPHAERTEGDEIPASTGPGSLRGRLDRSMERTIVLVAGCWSLVGVALALAFTRISPVALLAVVPPCVAGLVVAVRRTGRRHLPQVGWALGMAQLLTFVLLVVASFLSS